MRRGEVVLDREHVMALLKDVAFYTAVPQFQYLAETAKQSRRQWLIAKRTGECADCGREFAYMRGVCDAFWMKCREFVEKSDTAAIQALLAYLSEKKQYQVTQAVVYYRRSRSQGEIGKLVIT